MQHFLKLNNCLSDFDCVLKSVYKDTYTLPRDFQLSLFIC